jgi:hypothetical protein
LRTLGLLKFYEEGTSLRGNSPLLQQFICHWDHGRKSFGFNLDVWYHPTKEDVYFIMSLSKRGEIWPQISNILPSITGETQLAYL